VGAVETKKFYMFSGWSLAKCEVRATENSNHGTELDAPLSSREDFRARTKAKQTGQIATMNEGLRKELLSFRAMPKENWKEDNLPRPLVDIIHAGRVF
jgi:hypothetical protein